MRKKILVAMAVAAAMAAMPVVAGAAGSVHYSGGGSSHSSSTSTGTVVVGTGTVVPGTGNAAGSVTGTVVTSTQPSVQVTESGSKVTVAGTTKDVTGTTMGLVGESAGNGAVTSDGATVSVETGVAETAGLDVINATATNTIIALNSGADINTLLPSLGLGGYAQVGATRAIVSKNAAGADVPTTVAMYVSSLPANVSEVAVVCLSNATGQWTKLTAQVDPATKKVTFTVPGSCTIQFRAK